MKLVRAMAALGFSQAVLLAQSNATGLPAASAGATFFSLFRVMGALCIVLALFLGAVYVFRNWQRLLIKQSGRVPQLQIVEVKSLGPRQALYVVAYQSQRFLVASAPSGIVLLSALPDAPAGPGVEGAIPATGSFAEALSRTVARFS